MPAPLDVVIPTLNAADALPATLDALLEGVGAGLIGTLVLSDGGSRDATRAVAQAAGAVFVEGPSGRGGQLRRGVAATAAPWVLVLHADTHPPEGWSRVVLAHMQGPGGPAAFRLAFRSGAAMARVTARWANLRSGAFGLPYGDQGLLVSRADYDAAGGYRDIPLMEDVALVRALGRVRLLPAVATTSAERYERDGWVRRGARNLSILTRYLCGADPAALARSYRR